MVKNGLKITFKTISDTIKVYIIEIVIEKKQTEPRVKGINRHDKK